MKKRAIKNEKTTYYKNEKHTIKRKIRTIKMH